MRAPGVISLVLALLFLAPAPSASARTATLPLTLDYGFLRSAMIRQFFQTPDGRALAADDGKGCTRVELWEPRLGYEQGRLRVQVRARVRAGVTILGRCLDPIDWQGQLVLLQEPSLDRKTWRLTVRTRFSRVLDQQGRPAEVAGIVWRLIRENVLAYLDQFRVDLTPPLHEIEGLLPLVYPPGRSRQVRSWLETLRPGPVTVEPKGVVARLLMDVQAPPAPAGPAPPPGPEQRAAFIDYWQRWDLFLVHQMMALSGRGLTHKERNVLLATLVAQRLGFERALEGGPAQGTDLVREQFVATWRNLAPIMRRRLLDRPAPNLFSYLAFISASDALVALDELGPAFNLDISTDGLRRLARLVGRGQAPLPSEYSWQVDPNLRRLLGLGPPLPELAPRFNPRDFEPPEREPGWPWPGLSWLGRLVPRAWAGGVAPPGGLDLAPFLPQGPDLDQYLQRVMGVLSRAASKVLEDGKLSASHRRLFGLLAPAVAWQESCWRQFVLRRGDPTYLRSYNNTSVGLMQINERVWRGIYQRRSLRWDIRYNARAGCEILLQYLTRYALPHDSEWDGDLLARAVYAMYNGGPNQLPRFLKRVAKGRQYLSDRLFNEKLQKVKSGQPRAIPGCLR